MLAMTLCIHAQGIVETIKNSTTYTAELKKIWDAGGEGRFGVLLVYNAFTDEDEMPSADDYVQQNAWIIEYWTKDNEELRVKIIAREKTDELSPIICTEMNVEEVGGDMYDVSHRYYGYDISDSTKCKYAIISEGGVVTVLFSKGESNRVFKGNRMVVINNPKKKK